MKKYLIGVALGNGIIKNRTSSVTITMNDDYEPISDNPDDINSFPILRDAIYEYKQKHNVDGFREVDMFRPDNLSVTSISLLGNVEEEESEIQPEEDESGGDDGSIYITLNPDIEKAYHGNVDIFYKIIEALGEELAMTCYISKEQTYVLNGIWVINVKTSDADRINEIRDCVDAFVNTYRENKGNLYVNIITISIMKGDVKLCVRCDE